MQKVAMNPITAPAKIEKGWQSKVENKPIRNAGAICMERENCIDAKSDTEETQDMSCVY